MTSPIDSALPAETRRVMPTLPRGVATKLCALVEHMQLTAPRLLPSELRRINDNWADDAWALNIRAVAVVLADLLDQGWQIEVDGLELGLIPPGLRAADETVEQAKDRLRNSLYVGRDRQLADPSVRRFLTEMMAPPRVGKTARANIEALIDQGDDLAEALRKVDWADVEGAKAQLRGIIEPVIEVCDDRSRCDVTGLRLLDIWRFFRHTWALEYRSIPGRQLPILIRNQARPNRPIIGIALLASPVLRTRPRDNWIGWVPEAFYAKLRTGEWQADEMLESMRIRVDASIAEIRSDDLLDPAELANPSERVIWRLEQRAAGASAARNRGLQERYSDAQDAEEAIRSDRGRANEGGERDWRAASEDLLFVRKRSETLARLLYAKRAFQSVDWSLGSEDLLAAVLADPHGGRAISIALQEFRKAGLSSQIADVSVCGAVAPYNVLLGGKLVALLMASREMRDLYNARYSGQVSIISSQMAGAAISRPSELKIITTTSLYGNGSSQYNRLKLRASEHDFLSRDIAWQEIEKTAGFGTVHLGPASVRLLRQVGEREFGGRRVNHRFGEGASPRLRQIREGLDALGITSDSILHHSTPRLFYACKLEEDAESQLVGLSTGGRSADQSTSEIAEAWRTRWLIQRAQRPEILARLEQSGPREVVDLLSDVVRPDDGIPDPADDQMLLI